MNKKIICILICAVFLTTATSSVTAIKTLDKFTADTLIIDSEKTFSSDDAPIWKKGTVWTYKIDDYTIDYNGSGSVIQLHIGTRDFPLKVVNDAGSSYLVSFNAKISGNVYIETELSGYSIIVQGNLLRAQLKGELSYRKSDLAINSITAQLTAKVTLSMSQPRHLPVLRIPANLKLNVGFSNPYTFLFFPLEPDSRWGLPATTLSIDGSIRSPWLRIANIAHTSMRLMGLIPLAYQNLSDKIAQILPVIYIGDTLNLFNISNPLDIPELPDKFYCSGIETINVQAGTYNAYNISVLTGNIYYAPDIGNIIKITGYIKELFPILDNIHMELVNYKSTEE
jgi:hypothetical protein